MEQSNVLLFGTFPGFAEKEKKGVKIEIDGTYAYTNISAANSHIVVVTSVGTSFAFGSNSDWQLGVGDTVEFSNKFIPVITQEGVVSSKCGNNFTIWETTAGNYLIAGKKRFATPKKISEIFEKIDVCFDALCAILNETTLRFYHNYSENETFIEVSLPEKPQEISCSSDCCFALTEGSVLRLDSSGNLTCAFSYVPDIISIKSSCTFSLAKDKKGTIWMSGDIPNMKRNVQDGPITTGVISFYALPRQCFFQTDNYRFVGFGHNENGQLADGTDKKRVRATPCVIDGIGTGVAGNGEFTAIINSPFDDALLELDYKKITPSDLSTPLETNEDMFSYK